MSDFQKKKEKEGNSGSQESTGKKMGAGGPNWMLLPKTGEVAEGTEEAGPIDPRDILRVMERAFQRPRILPLDDSVRATGSGSPGRPRWKTKKGG